MRVNLPPKRFLVAYTVFALFVKSVVVASYAINQQRYSVAGTWDAVENGWIPSLAVYFCCACFVAAPSFLLRGRWQPWYLIALNLTLSAIGIIDLWYFRAFSRFTSLHHLHQSANLRHLSPAIISFIHPSDALVIADALIVPLIYLLSRKPALVRRNIPAFALSFFLPAGYLLYFNATHPIDEVRLFAVRWRPVETVAALSPIGYHFYDALVYWKETQQIRITADERREIRSWFEENRESLPPNQYKGLYRGYNLILLQCESLEKFVIGKSIQGQEITPSLNRLSHKSLYFPNYMEQVGDGTSSDAEFMNNTSVYPLETGSVFWRYPRNTYNSLPKLLERIGYTTVDIHPDLGSYWNWAEAMTSIGARQCVDATSFVQDETIDLGLSDGSFLRQSVPILTQLKQPFYAYMITLTSHGPFDLPGNLRELKLEPKLDRSEIGGYLQSIHYLDKQIGLFVGRLDRAGLLENSVVGIFGDHCGIHKFYQDSIAELPESQQQWMENGKRIPLLLYKKGAKPATFDVIGGQIDFLPSLAYLMGVDPVEYAGTAMGRNLLNTRRSFSVLNDGEYLASKYDQRRKQHALRGPLLANRIIQSDYFGSERPVAPPLLTHR